MSRYFDQDLSDSVSLARWAPSSHNCQPWKLVYLKRHRSLVTALTKQALPDDEEVLLLAIDKQRKLKALKSLELEMYISCGMFLALLCEVFSVQGYVCTLHWLCNLPPSEGLHEIEEKEKCHGLVLIRLQALKDKNDDAYAELEKNIRERRTHRAEFVKGFIDKKTKKRLFKSRWTTDFGGTELKLEIEDNQSTLKRSAELVARFAGLDFSHYQSWKETYRYIHFNEKNESKDGFYLQSLMGPMSRTKSFAMRLILAPLIMQVLRLVHLPNKMAAQLANLVSGSSQLLFCSVSKQHPDPKTLTKAGVRLMEIWLNAQALGIALHPVSVLLQHNNARQDLSRFMRVEGRLIFFARMGFIKKYYRQTPRRNVTDIVLFE